MLRSCLCGFTRVSLREGSLISSAFLSSFGALVFLYSISFLILFSLPCEERLFQDYYDLSIAASVFGVLQFFLHLQLLFAVVRNSVFWVLFWVLASPVFILIYVCFLWYGTIKAFIGIDPSVTRTHEASVAAAAVTFIFTLVITGRTFRQFCPFLDSLFMYTPGCLIYAWIVILSFWKEIRSGKITRVNSTYAISP